MNTKLSLQTIIDQGYCIGCGACASVPSQGIRMSFDRYGMLQPVLPLSGLDARAETDLLKICPFSDEGPDEDQFAEAAFPDGEADPQIGRYTGLYVGHVTEGAFRSRGSSGGVVSWILAEMLRLQRVDGIIHVGPAAGRADRLFAYRVSSSVEQVMEGAKSKYYPVELSEVLAGVRKRAGRYALVGVPCFIKAVRRLALQDPVIAERVVFYVGLVCGHLKSKAFADCIAWQVGIRPGHLQAVDFRVKLQGRRASNYGVTVEGDNIEMTAPAAQFFGSNWGLGFFKYSACDYCDDVFAETADISVGDAWLEDFLEDDKGNSIVIARSGEAEALLREGLQSGRLNLQACPLDMMVASQDGGLRHRRDGLACRLAMKAGRNEWAPRKRVTPSEGAVPARRREIYRLREELRAQSHENWIASEKAGVFSIFRTRMGRLVRRYDRAYAPLNRRIARRLCRILRAGSWSAGQ